MVVVLRQALLYVHLSGVFLLVAGVGASVACKVHAARVDSPDAVLALLHTARGSVRLAAMPGSLILLLLTVGLGLLRLLLLVTTSMLNKPMPTLPAFLG